MFQRKCNSDLYAHTHKLGGGGIYRIIPNLLKKIKPKLGFLIYKKGGKFGERGVGRPSLPCVVCQLSPPTNILLKKIWRRERGEKKRQRHYSDTGFGHVGTSHTHTQLKTKKVTWAVTPSHPLKANTTILHRTMLSPNNCYFFKVSLWRINCDFFFRLKKTLNTWIGFELLYQGSCCESVLRTELAWFASASITFQSQPGK